MSLSGMHIADREKAEQELRESEEKYRAIAELSPSGICLLDNDVILYANRAYAEILGFSGPEEVIGKRIFDVARPVNLTEDQLKEKMARIQADRANPPSELTVLRADGTPIITVLGRKTVTPEAKKSSPVTGHSLSETARRNARVLVVEDNAINLTLAQRLLEKFGYRADAVENGRKAVTALETAVYDVVLMDVQMPVMDGYEATSIIRDPNSAVLNHDVPVIAMTANALPEDRRLCLASGMDDHLSKPISPDELYHTLEKYIHVAIGEKDRG